LLKKVSSNTPPAFTAPGNSVPDVTLDSIRDIQLFQPKNGYRFSVDALLLFEFVKLKAVRDIADLGAGSGIIGILLAKKYPHAKVTLFELQENLVGLAEKNAALNRLHERVKAVKCDLRNHALFPSPSLQCDLAVSNPPFRRCRSGLLNSEEEKTIARHEVMLTFDDLAAAAAVLLKIRGRFCLIHHPNRLGDLIVALKEKGMEPKRLQFVHSSPATEAKMVLIEAVKGGRTGLKVEKPLYIYTEKGSYTEEMRAIYAV
jgi:tRNA1Val (adenine37-N6)-methyltransferase